MNTVIGSSNYLVDNLGKKEPKKRKSTYNHWLQYLTAIYISRFKWNIPDSQFFNSQYIERNLYWYGLLAGVNMKETGIALLPVQPIKWDKQYIPSMFNVMYRGGVRRFHHSKVALLYNDCNGLNALDMVRGYAIRIEELTKAFDLNVVAHQLPVIFPIDEGDKTSFNAMISEVDEGKRAVFPTASNFLNKQPIVLNSNIPMILKDLYISIQNIINLFCQEIGINGVTIEKSERLLTDEVKQSNSLNDLNYQTQLDLRKAFCDEMKNKFNYNISVEPRMFNKQETISKKDGEIDV